MTKIGIIVGSTRPGRFGPKVAAWIHELAAETQGATFEIIDLAEVNLPMFDEEKPPMMGQYQNDHTKAWAQTIDGFDGFIVVTPEYNHSFPASLKNAFDFLYAEWVHKPVAFVSYGAGAGGARAVEQLRLVAVNLRMFALNDHVAFANYWTQLNDERQLQPNEQQVDSAKELLKNIVFWSEKFSAARAELAS